jgi:hypothetical protein
MYTRKFNIRKDSGRLTVDTREILAEAVSQAPDGNFEIIIKQRPEGYSRTRYKFYFGSIVPLILLTCADKFKIVTNDGSMRTPTSAEEMHEVLKYLYNPVSIVTPKGAFVTGSTTTNLSDRDFIGVYLESIMSDFSNPPYNVDFSGLDM